MSSSPAAVAPAAALVPSSRSRPLRVIVAGGGRDLAWSHPRVAAELLGCSRGRPVHLLLHGGARGADAAIARAAQQLGWPVAALPVSTGPAQAAAAKPVSPGLWQLGIEAQDLTAQIARLAEQLDAENEATRTEAIAELEAALVAEEGNSQALVAKADATCWVIEHLRAQAAYRSQQARRLTELARSDAARADSLEQSLVLVLTRLEPGAVRFSFPHHELSSRRSQAVVIEDEEALDPRWLVVKSTAQPDKVAIREALMAGEEIAGAQLVTRRSWLIR